MSSADKEEIQRPAGTPATTCVEVKGEIWRRRKDLDGWAEKFI